MSYGRYFAVVLLGVLAACGQERIVPATQFVVSVNSDLEIGSELARVEVFLYEVEGGRPVEKHSFWVTDGEPLEGEYNVPFSFGIAKTSAQRFLLEVRGYGLDPESGAELETVRQTVITGFRARETLLLKVFLGSACLGVLCDEDDQVQATCYSEPEADLAAGSCGPIPERDAEPVKPRDEHDWSPIQAPRDAGAADMDGGGAADDGGSDAPDAGTDAGPPAPVTLDVTIDDDRDDATWILVNGVHEERLHYDDRENGAGRHIEVANDLESGRAGLRFVLPIPVGATISSARLFLQRFRNAEAATMMDWAPASATMQVQVFESPLLDPFDPSHRHAPTEHGPMPGIWASSVKGYRVGEFDEVVESPELKALVQHVIAKPDWAPGRAVSFLLSNDSIPATNYADFTDSSAGFSPPRLRVVYVPRP
jgi:hypothetical protein